MMDKKKSQKQVNIEWKLRKEVRKILRMLNYGLNILIFIVDGKS
jgi:aspartate-semialdehyde dehydrogenase